MTGMTKRTWTRTATLARRRRKRKNPRIGTVIVTSETETEIATATATGIGIGIGTVMEAVGSITSTIAMIHTRRPMASTRARLHRRGRHPLVRTATAPQLRQATPVEVEEERPWWRESKKKSSTASVHTLSWTMDCSWWRATSARSGSMDGVCTSIARP